MQKVLGAMMSAWWTLMAFWAGGSCGVLLLALLAVAGDDDGKPAVRDDLL